MDPIKRTIEKQPFKPFMINQLAIAFDRNNMILSPYDDLLHKQLVDYEVLKIAANGKPVFTDKNEHFVDALGLAYLAFVLEFPDITKTVFEVERAAVLDFTRSDMISDRIGNALNDAMSNPFISSNPWKGLKNGSFTPETAKDPNERDVPRWFQYETPVRRQQRNDVYGGWASRITFTRNQGFSGRSMW